MNNNTQSLYDLFAVHQSSLRERLQYFLATLHTVQHADVMRALQEPGKLLSPPYSEIDLSHPAIPAGSWALLTLFVALYISSEVDILYVSNVAVAVECFICALDLLDDIEDNDQTSIVQVLEPALMLNVSTALLMLAQGAILALSSQGVASDDIIRLSKVFQESALTATSGQHRDILAEARPLQGFTDEECTEIARQKAGSLMRLACLAGAVCAGADDNTCKLFAELGELLGIASQLDNDCHDLYYFLQDGDAPLASTEVKSAPINIKTDLVRGKKTLPIVIAAKSGVNLQKMVNEREKDQASIYALREGILATWGICLLYRERARDCLQELEAQRPVSPALRFLLGLA